MTKFIRRGEGRTPLTKGYVLSLFTDDLSHLSRHPYAGRYDNKTRLLAALHNALIDRSVAHVKVEKAFD